MRECEHCGKSIVRKNAQARYCSDHCRNYARRQASKTPFPPEMIRADRWIRRDSVKKPLRTDGRAASSTDPTTWSNFNEANRSMVGVGLGFVLGEGFGCVDLDHCLVDGKPNEIATRFLATVPSHYIEVSPSGDGLHIWGTAEAAPGSRKTIDGLNIERYSIGRYITVTGNVYQHGSLLPL